MVQEFKTPKGEFIALKLHKEAANIHLSEFYENKISYRTPTSLHFIEDSLPEGKWEMIGIAGFLTEDQITDIIEFGDMYPNEDNFHVGYPDHENFEETDSLRFRFENPTDSFSSLMNLLKCYSTNPWGEYPQLKYEFHDGIEYHHRAYTACLNRWNRAEERVGKWVIIKKL